MILISALKSGKRRRKSLFTPESGLEQQYRQIVFRKVFFLIAAVILLFVLTLYSLSHGAASISVSEALGALFNPESNDSFIKTVIWEIRLPRVCAALLAGAGLGLAGAVMQGILRNPLASPFTLGISSAAGFGASLAIVLGIGIGSNSHLIIISNAFIFALAAFVLVFFLARVRGLSPETLILSGIAVMYLFSSMTSFLQYIATAEQLSAVVFWMMGSLSGSSWLQVSVMGVVFLISSPLLMLSAWDFNAMASGSDSALTMGINVNRVTVVSMVISALLTASIISFTGVIGFIGLVAPHMTRMLTGGDHRFLLPSSSISGALLLLAADTLSRNLIPPSEIPLGIMTSFIGVPFFIYILLTRRKGSIS
ncbi:MULTISPECIES: iron ABC transporter permease [unclassified Oceanispirochaeta]|uniref:FecCD family ABC transporter permease n=1 Tax=unclassified Oceanispirochaeta TaxID=2635722 RepID=UPI0018F77E20|nr:MULTISPECIES: iron ABC transporter permease [unclassified Oceanispirochaeta]